MYVLFPSFQFFPPHPNGFTYGNQKIDFENHEFGSVL